MKPRPLEIVLHDVPIPPSVNRMHIAGTHSLTSAWRKWREDFGKLLLGKPKLTGPWSIEIVLPRKTRGDCDNRLKIVLDSLVKFKWVDDDRHCQSATSRRGDICYPYKGCMIIVRALPLQQEKAA